MTEPNDYPGRKPFPVPGDQLNPDGTVMEASAADLAETPPDVIPPMDFVHRQDIAPGGNGLTEVPNPGRTQP